MTINISGRMARKSTVRDLNGNIIDLIDETDGGWIIRGRRVVNQEKFEKMVQAEKDKKEAALAATKSIVAPEHIIEARGGKPGKTEELEKRINNIESKLDAILKAINKK